MKKEDCKCEENSCQGKGQWFFISGHDFECMQEFFDKRADEGYSDYIVIVGKPGNCPPGGCH